MAEKPRFRGAPRDLFTRGNQLWRELCAVYYSAASSEKQADLVDAFRIADVVKRLQAIVDAFDESGYGHAGHAGAAGAAAVPGADGQTGQGVWVSRSRGQPDSLRPTSWDNPLSKELVHNARSHPQIPRRRGCVPFPRGCPLHSRCT